MLNIGRRDLPPNTYKEPEKPLVKPLQGSSPIAASTGTQQFPSNARVTTPAAPVLRDNVAMPNSPADASNKEADAKIPAIGPDTPGSKLWVGPKIKLKGVEISDCDVLVVEGEVEATVNSKAMQIAQPGTLKGHVTIDVAEVYGDFSGELHRSRTNSAHARRTQPAALHARKSLARRKARSEAVCVRHAQSHG